MQDPIIQVTNISKKYIISHQRYSYKTLRDVIVELVKKPFHIFSDKKISKKEDFWALKDINFNIKQGDAIGLIGHNGSGKSTLLKILSQITEPTTGEAIIYGQVASLLEIGTGFHPELTGRENVILNGSILGMSRKEINEKFDSIVKFADVEQFIDTPVKRYSSGMQVRLAFSVAAHMDPDILIIDEVLAVGDADFQEKAFGKMEEVKNELGRTIIFVSHNMEAIKKVCKKCILLKEGKIVMYDDTEKVIKKYLNKDSQSSITSLDNRNDRIGDGDVRFTEIDITNHQKSKNIRSGDGLRIALKYKSKFIEKLKDVRVVIAIVNDKLQPILWLDSDVSIDTFDSLTTEGEIVCETKGINLIEGRYFVDINFHIKGRSLDLVKMAGDFNVTTDINKYNYKIRPEMEVCDYIVEYHFKQ